ncbi:hypothetical protein BL253_27755 [Pseudofrankia asymbiotica]|uniref:Lecithin--cholesterol acyltransferase n=2 Tax=Pseudofrankia asymbiotica TaxID=1834516 RepID=A0A1V2I549_9ACTN|nr:hypothetical protein BL253_27755 [Pseudofrankia asymbiotica]
MGSELVEAESGRVLWGLRDPGWYVSAWTSGRSLKDLAVTEDERAGRYERVRATRLLTFAAFAPVLGGFEPYRRLSRTMVADLFHPAAVLEFAYDWRLPVDHNAHLLANAAQRHLAAWRRHPACDETLRRRAVDGDVRLVLVAHSMGGLVTRKACADAGFAGLVRKVVTLGTPFFGAPKAVLMMGSGRGFPLPRARLRSLARALPGVYDLLPGYRCVRDGIGARRLTVPDVTSIGGDADLAAEAFSRRATIPDRRLPGHTQVVGAFQPTVQAVTIEAGQATGHRYTILPPDGGAGRTADLGGDGTVPRESAESPGPGAVPLAQSHGALAASEDAMVVVRDTLDGLRSGPWQGASELGLDAPDVIAAGRPFTVEITGAGRTGRASCSVFDAGTGLRVATPVPRPGGEALMGEVESLPPGLFWIQADGGGRSQVRRMVMSFDPAVGDPDGGGE